MTISHATIHRAGHDPGLRVGHWVIDPVTPRSRSPSQPHAGKVRVGFRPSRADRTAADPAASEVQASSTWLRSTPPTRPRRPTSARPTSLDVEQHPPWLPARPVCARPTTGSSSTASSRCTGVTVPWPRAGGQRLPAGDAFGDSRVGFSARTRIDPVTSDTFNARGVGRRLGDKVDITLSRGGARRRLTTGCRGARAQRHRRAPGLDETVHPRL